MVSLEISYYCRLAIEFRESLRFLHWMHDGFLVSRHFDVYQEAAT